MSRQDLYERSPASFRDNVFGGGAASDDVDVFFARFCFRGQRCVEIGREYFGDFHAVDEWRARIGNLPDSRLAPIPSPSDEVERKNPAVLQRAGATQRHPGRPQRASRRAGRLAHRLDDRRSGRGRWLVIRPARGGRAPAATRPPVRAGPAGSRRCEGAGLVAGRSARDREGRLQPAGPARTDRGGQPSRPRAAADRRPGGPYRLGPGRGRPRSYARTEPRSNIAGRGQDHPGHRRRDGPERDHDQVAYPANLRQAQPLPTDRTGAAGGIPGRRSGSAARRLQRADAHKILRNFDTNPLLWEGSKTRTAPWHYAECAWARAATSRGEGPPSGRACTA